MQRLNCAIYTRKSTEEGLEMAFNSLEAQREACEAYIASQKLEGWKVVPTLYDDGGFSGGNIERPGLKQLMKDIEAGKVQVVVVYKVDRLTRSLADFAKIVELFDSKGVSFVSVTQQFNTTSSMGRLTLNVLLSFAQFEREVTGERIRDKIAASKRKGMFMGGVVPLGYKVENRLLHIVPEAAEKVRYLYEEYLKLGNVDVLQKAIGTSITGRPMSRGALYSLLQNPIYVGKTRHKKEVFEGQHDAILEEELWQQVQDMLSSNRTVRKNKRQANNLALTGIVFGEVGERLTPMATTRKGKRYSYYVAVETKGSEVKSLRVPAGDLERIVARELVEHTQDNDASVKPQRIIVGTRQIMIQMPDGTERQVNYQFAENGPFRKIVEEGGISNNFAENEAVRKLVIQGLKWRKRLFEEPDMTVLKLGEQEGVDPKHLVRVMGTTLIEPSLIEKILRSECSSHINRSSVLSGVHVWADK